MTFREDFSAPTIPDLMARGWGLKQETNGGRLALATFGWWPRRRALVATAPGGVKAKASLMRPIPRVSDGGIICVRQSLWLDDTNDASLLFLCDLEDSTVGNMGLRLRLRGQPGDQRLAVDLESVGSVTPLATRVFPRRRWVTVEWQVALGNPGRVVLVQDGIRVLDAIAQTSAAPMTGVDRLEVGVTINASPAAHEVRVDWVEVETP